MANWQIYQTTVDTLIITLCLQPISSSPQSPTMATESLETLTPSKIKKTFEDLESEKALITAATAHFAALTGHFATLSQTLTLKSHSLDLELRALDSQTDQTLISLTLRESSIPDLESQSAASIQSKKDAVIAELEDPSPLVESKEELLRVLCRRMDWRGVWRFLVENRNDLGFLGGALAEAVDGCKLVIDAVEGFLDSENREEGGCEVIGMLVRGLFDEEGKKGPEVGDKVRARAGEVAWKWREKGIKEVEGGKEGEEGGKDGGEGGGEMGGAEAEVFLWMVVAFGLKGKFEEEELRRLVVENSSRKEMAKVFVGLGFGDKMADIINELVKSGKELDAVYFACEAGLTEKFAPASLLKTYLQKLKEKAFLKNGNRSAATIEESNNLQLSTLRAVINCVESYKLESQFDIEGLKIRLSHIEKSKGNRKKTAASNKSQNKRAHASASTGAPNFRHQKSSKIYPSYGSSYFNPTHQIPPVGRNTYTRQQYYNPDEMGGPRSGGPYGGAPVGNYSGYDYGAPHSAPAQSHYPH